MFRMPALTMVEAQQRRGTPVYNYCSPEVARPGGAFGACHALELGFLFGTYDAVFCGTGTGSRTFRNMQDGGPPLPGQETRAATDWARGRNTAKSALR